MIESFEGVQPGRLVDSRRTRKFFQQWQNIPGISIVLVFIAMAISADWLTPSRDIYWAGEISWEK